MAKSEHLIIDTMKPLGQFLKYTEIFKVHGRDISSEHVEEFLDHILGRVVDCVSIRDAAMTQLWDYARQLKEDSCNPAEGVKLAKGVLEFGESLNQHLKDLGAYNQPSNYLGYYYSGRIGHADLILTKLDPREQY